MMSESNVARDKATTTFMFLSLIEKWNSTGQSITSNNNDQKTQKQ